MEVPKKVYKLAISSEVQSFHTTGKICSSLDATDQFIHLSDRNAVPNVAKMFFTEATDLHLMEINAEILPSPVNWVVGKMGDEAPVQNDEAGVTVHYLLPEGCVHVFGQQGVPMSAVLREEHVPLVDDSHVFPAWL
mmetsp:Transcript_14224/g.20939  ORF Transcript_14224/g.20939 Transcript_14224/m.20939 type:complete len:136 (-) Transcript_14224:212-619(-)